MSEEIRKKIEKKPSQHIQTPCGNPEHEKRMQQNGFCDWCRQDVFGINEPSQDELWEELDNTCIKVLHNGEVIFLSQEAKKRYRITRITS